MRIKKVGSFRSLVVGMVIGLLIGSVGLVYSAMGKEGWDRQTAMFKLGYIIGSTDILRMVKRTTPGHSISLSYTIPRAAKPIDWLFHVEQLFADPKNKDRNITQIISFAGSDMEQAFGGDITIVSGLEQLGEALRQRREAILSGEIEPTPPEVVAKRQAAAAKTRARNKCIGGCRKSCRDTCEAEITEEVPPQNDSADDSDPPKAAE